MATRKHDLSLSMFSHYQNWWCLWKLSCRRAWLLCCLLKDHRETSCKSLYFWANTESLLGWQQHQIPITAQDRACRVRDGQKAFHEGCAPFLQTFFWSCHPMHAQDMRFAWCRHIILPESAELIGNRVPYFIQIYHLFDCSDINQAVSKATSIWSDLLRW